MSLGNGEEPVKITSDGEMVSKSKIILNGKLKKIIGVVIVILIILLGVLVYRSQFSIEGKAKNVVSKYAKAIQKGESTYEYSNPDVDDFVHIIDYKFVKIMDIEEREKTYTVDADTYKNNENSRDFYERQYEYYKLRSTHDSNIRFIDENELEKTFTVTLDETYHNVVLLYDMELANRAGDKFYKRVYFTVSDEDEKFKIADILY